MPAKDGPGGIMSPAEVKQLLHLARRQAVNCAIAMDKAKQGHILMHRRTKPKKLLAELRRQAKAAGIEVDPTSLRFGRASVDGASDSGMVTFTVNKPAPGPMRRALLEQVRPAGLQRCEIIVDEGLENEAEDGGDEAGDGGAGAHEAEQGTGGGGTGGAAGHAPTGAAAGGSGQGGPASAPSGDTPARAGAAGTGVGDAAPPAPATGGRGGTAAPGAASVRARFATLAPRVADALASDLPGAEEMRAALGEARGALASGDLATVARAAGTLERLLAAAPRAATAARPPSVPADGGAPGTATPAASGTPAGGPASGQGPSVPPPGPAGSAAPAPGTPTDGRVIEKGKAAWQAVRAKFQADIDATLSEMVATYGDGDPRCRAIHGRVEAIMRQIDDELAARLGEMAEAGDPGARAAKAREARAIIARYRGYVDGEPMIAELDRNPFHPMTLRRTVDAALAALSKVLDISERAGQP